MKVGYIRVSKQEQNEALQRDALKEAGCEKYFSEKSPGRNLSGKDWRSSWPLCARVIP